MLIEKGRIVAEGTPDDVVAMHEERSAQRRAEAAAAGIFLKADARPGGRRRRR
jgi:hypothetical protein